MWLDATGVGMEKSVDLETLQNEHQHMERRLAELEKRIYLSPSEQVERMRLKKLKLATKDQIQKLSSRPM
jgi:hypothetical protein